MATRINKGRKSVAIAVPGVGENMVKMEITRRALRDDDVDIDILYSGICHSDIAEGRGEWGPGGMFPMITGHEIVGKVVNVGSSVTKYKVNDIVGVGCMVDSCQKCSSCHSGSEQYCEGGRVFTYNDKMRFADNEVTYGGYSQILLLKNPLFFVFLIH